jgi:hypothetical protein
MAIEGQIARIIDEGALIVNRGAKDGVTAGTRFAVFVQVEDVVDPETGKSLGKWELVKGEIQARHVQESMAICAPAVQAAAAAQSDPTYTLSASMIEASLAVSGSSGKLNVDRSQVSGKPAAGPIRVGDRVRSIG